MSDYHEEKYGYEDVRMHNFTIYYSSDEEWEELNMLELCGDESGMYRLI